MTVGLGITGGTGSGKTTLAEAVARRLGDDVVLISQDHYYRDLSRLPLAERAASNFDAPDAIELDLLAEHLRALVAGRPIDRPEYDMRTHVRTGVSTRIDPRPVIVADGTLIATHPGIRSTLDFLVFVELDEDLRLVRRIRRDVSNRGRTEAEVRRRWKKTVAPMHLLHVEPARASADLVLRGDGDVDEMARTVAALLP